MKDRYDFTWDNIKKAPNTAGVYALYDGGVPIYYGRAQGGSVTIRSRLSDHKSGRAGTCTMNATAYSREATDQAVSRERELLQEFVRLNGQLPRCNDVMP